MLSIAIATMRRWPFLRETLPQMLERPEVGEVILSDETGEDVAEVKKTIWASHPKLRMSVNDSVLGIYENKVKAAKLAKGPWVAILDSDNLFPESWFFVLADLLEKHNGQKILFASAEFQNINLQTGESSTPCKDFSGLTLNAANWNRMFQRPGWNFLLNDGNWVVPREAVDCLPTTVKSSDLLAADAIFMTKQWIAAGYTLWYVPELVYIHTVHPGSTWILTAKESTRIFNETRWEL